MQQIENTIQFTQAPKQQRLRPVELIPRTRNQERLIMALQDTNQHIVVTAGPAGTGKTYLAMLAAVRAFRAGEVDRIVLTRPAVGVEDEKHGFLPGDLNQKMDPWVRPLTDILREYYRPQDIADMLVEQKIEIAPLAFMRGRTCRNSYISADEMQKALTTSPKPTTAPKDDGMEDLTATCRVHGDPLIQAVSAKTGKPYWYHMMPNGERCWGK
jgi:phosphate starvation-inducible PhoH-like protein